MLLTSIEYIDGIPTSYKYVEIHNDGNETIIFDSGDIIKDWYYHNKYITFNTLDSTSLGNSSSVDHFVMDCNSIDSSHLVFEGVSYELHKDGFGLEYFVKGGTNPTWDELRKYCGDEFKEYNYDLIYPESELNITTRTQIKESTDLSYLNKLVKYIQIDIKKLEKETYAISELKAKCYGLTTNEYVERASVGLRSFIIIIETSILKMNKEC